ncbi:GRRM system radical SAM/SPASM domain protein [Cyanobium sp. ATX 6A2]|uniref:cyclophane-forming radical SAM/SPASM peptide maturase GrrM/OscB n=1 Tax=Cyanobium sp. ATX 6A2 TaxID=2823700 RepID=UPI0020CC7FBF|nr:cyclophane-forming radical SAM/SPASM peptide maturase GrrM/OscB [Cyanobium sp. ATX 6A2]MCP9889376.1 GRRM system radical SAM/SPASM domain protein [Cyanobium sp. ATX 6A2]
MALPPADCGPIELVVIQPTPYCNLDCDYCYLPDRNDRSQLPLDLLEPILKAVLTSPFVGSDITILWHAGEPLAVPVSFYDEATRRLGQAEARHKRHPIAIGQSIQTNATLIDQAWCDCFLRNGIQVGVSLDGPAFLHDAHRRTRTGLGTHAATMRGIAHLRRNAIPFHVIAVLTSESLDHADAIVAFFLEHGITEVGFNMEETEGSNRSSSLEREGSEARYRAFLERVWELTEQSQGAFRLREFETTSALACTDSRLERTDMNRPFVILNVDHRGNFSTFDPELLAVKTQEYGDFVLGNILTDSLESVCATEKFQRIHRDMQAGIERCRCSCEFFGLCGGGAGSNKYWERGTFDCAETQACRYRIKIVADVVLAGLEATLGLAGDRIR